MRNDFGDKKKIRKKNKFSNRNFMSIIIVIVVVVVVVKISDRPISNEWNK